MTNVVIASAARTAVGSFGGAFANTPAHDLGAAVLAEVVARAGIDPSEVSETILGQVLTAAQGQNPASGAHQCRFGERSGCMVTEPGLRIRPSRRGAGRAAHHAG